MANTIEDLKDVEGDAEEKSTLHENMTSAEDKPPTLRNVSIFEYCRKLCKSLLDECDSFTVASQTRVRCGEETPPENAGKKYFNANIQLIVSNNIVALNKSDGSGNQMQIAGSTTDEELQRLVRRSG